MRESQVLDLLTEAIYEHDENNENDMVKSVRTFEEAMVMTSNKGIVLKLKDGSEFQITVVKSK